MKLHIEASSEDEFRKGLPELVSRFAKAVEPYDAKLARLLNDTSTHDHDTDMKFPVIRAEVDGIHALYQQSLDAMLREVGATLDAHVDRRSRLSTVTTCEVHLITKQQYDEAIAQRDAATEVINTDKLPFAFYDVKGETDAQTTRGTVVPRDGAA